MPARRQLRALAWRLAPSLMAERDRRHQARVRQQYGIPSAAADYVREHGSAVTAGPLAGLRYPAAMIAHLDMPTPKLAGEFEHQLAPALAEAIDRLRESGRLFVDVGGSEGYYAVGIPFAARCDAVAFEAAASGRAEIRTLAAANGVHVEVHGVATERRLLRLAGSVGVMLVDVDGAELRIVSRRLARAPHDDGDRRVARSRRDRRGAGPARRHARRRDRRRRR